MILHMKPPHTVTDLLDRDARDALFRAVSSISVAPSDDIAATVEAIRKTGAVLTRIAEAADTERARLGGLVVQDLLGVVLVETSPHPASGGVLCRYCSARPVAHMLTATPSLDLLHRYETLPEGLFYVGICCGCVSSLFGSDEHDRMADL